MEIIKIEHLNILLFILQFIVILCAMILIQLLLSSMASQGTRDGLAGSVEKGFKDLWEEELKEPGALAYYEKWVRQA